jgi:hypothetical protein
VASIVENYEEVSYEDVATLEEAVTVPAGRHVKQEKCCVCGVRYPTDDMVMFKGRWYCHAFGCADDIRGIILEEQHSIASLQSAMEE